MYCVLYAFVCTRVIHQTPNFTLYKFFLLLSLHVHPNHLYRLALDFVFALFFGPIYNLLRKSADQSTASRWKCARISSEFIAYFSIWLLH